MLKLALEPTAFIPIDQALCETKDVLHVPAMGKNLLSVGVSIGRGLSFWFSENQCWIFGSESSPQRGKLYPRSIRTTDCPPSLAFSVHCRQSIGHSSACYFRYLTSHTAYASRNQVVKKMRAHARLAY